jgi:uncharacterized protein (DUF58 family)
VNAQIQLNNRILPILTGFLILMQMIDPSRVWMFLLIGVGGAWIASYLWVRTLSRHLHLKREVRFGWAQVGDQIEERFTIKNTSWLPAPWVEILDHSDMPGYQVSRGSGIDGLSTNSWQTKGVCNQRGLFTLGPTSLRSSDPFGFYFLTLHNPASTSLLVMPPIIPLPTIEVASGGRSGDGHPRANAPERTVSAGSVREYVPGDSLHSIHWRTTARRNSNYVRVFDGTPAGDWWIFLDMEADIQAGDGWDSTVESGVILASSLADRGLRSRVPVGLAVNSEELIWLPPHPEDEQRYEILRGLALARPSRISLADLLVRNKPDIGRRSSLILITPNVGGTWIEALLPLLWRGAVPTVLLLDPRSFGGTDSPEGILKVLTDLGISRHVITRDLLDRPEARPGHTGQWEWRISATGRAIPIKTPGDINWKVLS